MNLPKETLNYLLRFLTGLEDESSFNRFRIGYTSNENDFQYYDLVFYPSGFFTSDLYGTPESLPQGDLPQIEGVPFLYGSDRKELHGNTLVVYADFVATAFFFLSRYEEVCLREIRDEHGRFPGKQSILYRKNLIFRPLIEEYAKLVRIWLRGRGISLSEPEPIFSNVWLTHDIDEPFYCKGFRSFMREFLYGKGFRTAWKFYFQKTEKDPYYTFPWMIQQDAHLRETARFPVQRAYFIKAGGNSPQDKPVYSLKTKRFKKLLKTLQEDRRIILGLHGSYSSGKGKASREEKKLLETTLKKRVTCFRNHFLRSCEPEHFRSLATIGITDDFSMGYADVAGFRYASCRPSNWIDPINGNLSTLVMHPQCIMDSTLYKVNYMGLDYQQAMKYCTLLLHNIKIHGGEACLLWHNTTLTESHYPMPPASKLRDFYLELLERMNNL